jgi:hypothetical protein
VFEQCKAFDPLAESLRKIAATRPTASNSSHGVGHFIDQLVSSSVTIDSVITAFFKKGQHVTKKHLLVVASLKNSNALKGIVKQLTRNQVNSTGVYSSNGSKKVDTNIR